MSEHRHCIQRQRFELVAPSEGLARELQETLCLLNNESLVPMMDELFSAHATAEESIRLNRVELDLGILTAAEPQQLAEQLAARLHQHLGEVLSERIRNLRTSSARQPGEQICRPVHSRLEVLCYFLQTGGLPWWVADSSCWDLQPQLLDLIEHSPKETATALRHIASPRVAARIFKQLSPQSCTIVIKLLAPAQASIIEEVIDSWILLLSSPLPDSECNHTALPDLWLRLSSGQDAADFVWREAIAWLLKPPATSRTPSSLSLILNDKLAVLSGNSPDNLLQDLAACARQLLPSGSQVAGWFAAVSARSYPGESQAWSDRQQGREQTSSFLPADESAAVVRRQSRHQVPEHPADRASGSSKRAGEIVESAIRQKEPSGGKAQEAKTPEVLADQVIPLANNTVGLTDDHLDSSQEYYVNNAGLVLLWPYLKHLFNELGLMEQKRFCSTGARERALLLLQHLVTDDSQWPEYQLMLNKLLCGWPLHEPVVSAIELTARELQESQALLASVISHWSALKATSVAGLRAAFLQREGKIRRQGLGWQIQIARTGYDVLLDKLPWGIGFIMLPWNEEPLFVEW